MAAAVSSMPLLMARVATTWVPRWARRRSRRPSSRERSACEFKRAWSCVVMWVSWAWRVFRAARISEMEEAS